VKLEKSFVVSCPRETLLPALDDDATFTRLFPDTRIVSHDGNRRETATPYTAVGQTRDIRFVFETQPEGRLCFEKVCDGNVWRSLRGEVRLEPEGDASTRVVIQMEGQTRALVPELAIRLPMRQQLDEMARSLRERLEPL
jgi:carbon monoxide dehydrogenase subunit G